MQLIFILGFMLSQTLSPAGIMKTSEIKPGMKGYGLTVFKGNKIEKFKIEVISVMHNVLLKQDLILVKCSHPIINHAGIIAGMSGSPIYINGKFAGGLGYGFSFSKDPIAMLTPAETIIKTMNRPVYNFDVWGRKSLKNSHAEWKASKLFGKSFFTASISKNSSTIPLATPVSISGISTSEFKKFFPKISEMGPVTPSGSGAASSSTSTSSVKPFAPGAPVAIWLISGDINVAAIGTVTHILGKKMAIFSHPFMKMGELRLPVAHAWIHTVIARQLSSFKLGTMTMPQGVMIKDEQGTVVVDKSENPGFIPVNISIVNPKETPHKYKFKVAKHRLLTANLINSLVRFTLYKTSQNITDLTYTIQYEIKSEALSPIKFTDAFASTKGIKMGFGYVFANSRGIFISPYSPRGQIALNLLLNNPFKRVALKSVNIKIFVSHGMNLYGIRKLELPSSEVSSNKEIPLKIYLKPAVGKEVVKTVKIKLPNDFKGTRVMLNVTSGRETPVDDAMPQNFNQLFKYLTETFDSHSLVISFYTPAPAADMNGVLVKNLPLSVLDSITTRTTSERTRIKQVIYRKVIRLPQVLFGQQKIPVIVKDKEDKAI